MKLRRKLFVSLVVYCYNEGPRLVDFGAMVLRPMRSQFDSIEVIFVDDASADDTATIAHKMLIDLGIIGSVMTLTHRHFRERALFAGADKCIGDYILEFDTPDIDFPIVMIERMFDASEDGSDLVALTPNQRPDIITRLYYWIFNKFSFIPAEIARQRVLLSSRRALNGLLNINERSRNRQILSHLVGFRLRRVFYDPIKIVRNVDGGIMDRTAIALDNLVSYSSIGSRLPLMLSACFGLFTFAVIIYVLASLLLRREISSGWTSIMLFMGIGFTGLFLILSLLSLYVTKTIREAVNLPIYTIRATRRNCAPEAGSDTCRPA